MIFVFCLPSCGQEEGAEAAALIDPTEVAPSSLRLCAGPYYACVVTNEGGVRCWGQLFNAGLGYGNGNAVLNAEEAPLLSLGVKVNQVSCGDNHICVRTENGTARCWGEGDKGKLGYGNTSDISDASLAQDINLDGTPIISITAGQTQTCVVTDENKVRCWGRNDQYNRLGDQNVIDDVVSNPLSIREFFNNEGIQHVYIATHKCALDINPRGGSNLLCWGVASSTIRHGVLGPSNISGAWGIDSFGDSGALRPCLRYLDIPDDNRSGCPSEAFVIQGAVASGVTCALLLRGDIRCWGSGSNGRLGYGNKDNVNGVSKDLLSLSLKGGVRALQIDVGVERTCILTETGGVRCWGVNVSAQLGYNHSNPVLDASRVDDFALGVSVKSIAVGREFSCAITTEDKVRCWGIGSNGQLGHGTRDWITDASQARDLDVL